ncbi:hypothetical protein MACJ_001318 [Theileria orientalis]|uniref:Uncharacterized protein n=1 Tax=Theileria orientalis TaxID=68886 RepID=A0A976QSD7_THEOR|nr:hypothetical protein MACJ_001318 [Theileria orientalis]
MRSDTDKILSVHRSQVQSSLWGTLNVFNSFLLFTGLDLIILGYHWFLHFMACRMYACGAFRNELIINTVFTIVPILSLIPCSFFFYVATLMHVVRFWHICHVAGRLIGLIMFNMVRLFIGGSIKIWFTYCKSFILVASTVPTGLLRLVLAIASLWFCLVLHSIRLVGGTGKEFKSAEELESETVTDIESTESEHGKMFDIV